jgi:hypothetical protein
MAESTRQIEKIETQARAREQEGFALGDRNRKEECCSYKNSYRPVPRSAPWSRSSLSDRRQHSYFTDLKEPHKSKGCRVCGPRAALQAIPILQSLERALVCRNSYPLLCSTVQRSTWSVQSFRDLCRLESRK